MALVLELFRLPARREGSQQLHRDTGNARGFSRAVSWCFGVCGKLAISVLLCFGDFRPSSSTRDDWSIVLSVTLWTQSQRGKLVKSSGVAAACSVRSWVADSSRRSRGVLVPLVLRHVMKSVGSASAVPDLVRAVVGGPAPRQGCPFHVP